MKRFQDRNVLITGAASGIGFAAAKRIASEGGNLALLDINSDQLKIAIKQLKQFNTKIVYEVCNVADFNAKKNTIDNMCEKIGGIQALSHNAGILKCYNTHEMTLEQWNEILSIN
jgi:NAD(P)-dependent dehydrogenase (short-subunit alcohol dehydrogenase family)